MRNMIKTYKRSWWAQYLKSQQILNSIPINTFIPTLEGKAIINKQKTNTLKKIFFPSSLLTDLSDILKARYPKPMPTNHNITTTQVKRAINKLAPNKAPRSNEIPNHVLKRCLSTLQSYILALAQQSMLTDHFP